MYLRKQKAIIIAIAVFGSLLFAPQFVWAEEEPSGESIILDALVIRPVGILSIAAGTVIFAVSSPFALVTGSTKTAAKKLIVEPYKFTFKRPLGEYEQYY
jgi:hypothetical protein